MIVIMGGTWGGREGDDFHGKVMGTSRNKFKIFHTLLPMKSFISYICTCSRHFIMLIARQVIIGLVQSKKVSSK